MREEDQKLFRSDRPVSDDMLEAIAVDREVVWDWMTGNA